MSEVRRWKLKGFIPGIEGESKAVFQPTVILAEDYDAALAREAAERLRADVAVADCNEAERREGALREELAAIKKKLGDAYEWGYSDGQNCPNGYSDEKDREKCVAELLKPKEGEGEGS